jgi:hypothetical protein
MKGVVDESGFPLVAELVIILVRRKCKLQLVAGCVFIP